MMNPREYRNLGWAPRLRGMQKMLKPSDGTLFSESPIVHSSFGKKPCPLPMGTSSVEFDPQIHRAVRQFWSMSEYSPTRSTSKKTYTDMIPTGMKKALKKLWIHMPTVAAALFSWVFSISLI